VSRRVVAGVAVAAVAAVVLLTGASASTDPVAARRAKIGRALADMIEAGAPGAVVVFRDGSRTLRMTAGVADTKRKTPMRVGDRFRIGSVTKSFVAVVVLQLVGERRLSLGDTVERWLPGLVPNGENITVRQLLDHTSGLYDYTEDKRLVGPYLRGDFGHVWSPKALVGLATDHKPLFAPGKRWSYSNTNYILLGLVVRAVTGKPVTDELRRRIIARLGLHDTSLDAQARIAGSHAHGYSLVGRPSPTDVSRVSPTWAWTAGAITSTADDVLRFYRALFRGRLLQPRLLHLMEVTVDTGHDVRYGLGLFRTRLPCGVVWGHNGNFPGYLAYAFNSRDGRRQLVVLVNEDSLPGLADAALQRLLVNGYCG
jgi:D-alanyl-D-alanine carboxypeptidase